MASSAVAIWLWPIPVDLLPFEAVAGMVVLDDREVELYVVLDVLEVVLDVEELVVVVDFESLFVVFEVTTSDDD